MSPSEHTTPQIQPVPFAETELEPMYRVIIHNDDITPMDAGRLPPAFYTGTRITIQYYML
jgi:hypothetical protein